MPRTDDGFDAPEREEVEVYDTVPTDPTTHSNLGVASGGDAAYEDSVERGIEADFAKSAERYGVLPPSFIPSIAIVSPESQTLVREKPEERVVGVSSGSMKDGQLSEDSSAEGQARSSGEIGDHGNRPKDTGVSERRALPATGNVLIR